MQDFLKVNLQVESVGRKANAMLTFILRGQIYKSKDAMLRLYKASVKPHFEYGE